MRGWLKICLLCMCSVSNAVNAEQYYWQLSHRMAVSSNDNYALDAADRQVQVAADDASILWGWQSDRSQLGLTAQNHFRRYAGETGDADDMKTSQSPELGLNWAHKPNVRSDLGVDLNYLRDRTTADEYLFSDDLLGNERVTGIVLDQDKEREQGSASVNASFMQTETWQWFGRFDGSATQYRQASDTQLLSYQDTSWTGGAFHLLHENWDVYWQGAYSTYLPRPGDTFIQQINATRTRTKSLSLGVRARFEGGAKLNLSLGSRRTTMDHLINHRFDKGRGTVASLEFSRPVEFGQWQITAGRALQPDSTGEIVERDNLSVSVRCNQTERLYHDLSWSWRNEQSPQTDQTEAEAELYRAWAWQLGYRVTETHTFSLGLQHRQQNAPDRFEGNRVELSWRWNGPRNGY